MTRSRHTVPALLHGSYIACNSDGSSAQDKTAMQDRWVAWFQLRSFLMGDIVKFFMGDIAKFHVVFLYWLDAIAVLSQSRDLESSTNLCIYTGSAACILGQLN